MGNQWQRCAAGLWSEVMNCAAGTICSPRGQTVEFFVQFSDAPGAPPVASPAAVATVPAAPIWMVLTTAAVALCVQNGCLF